jgi:carbohydrate kinase (thermoresistant glucokinase family)
MIYILFGLPGTGKSTIGKMLAYKLKIEHHDIDEYIPKNLRERIKKGIPVSEEERNKVFERFANDLKKFSNEKDYVISAYIAKERHRNLIKKSCNSIVFFYLNAPEEILIERLKSRKGHFLGENYWKHIMSTFEATREDYIIIDATKTPDEVVRQIMLHIS